MILTAVNTLIIQNDVFINEIVNCRKIDCVRHGFLFYIELFKVIKSTHKVINVNRSAIGVWERFILKKLYPQRKKVLLVTTSEYDCLTGVLCG